MYHPMRAYWSLGDFFPKLASITSILIVSFQEHFTSHCDFLTAILYSYIINKFKYLTGEEKKKPGVGLQTNI